MQEQAYKEEISESRQEASLLDREYYNVRNRNRPISRNKQKNRKSTSFTNIFNSNNITKRSYLEMSEIFDEKILHEEGGTIEQLITDLYPVMKDDISIFLHSKHFTKDTPPYEFLQWMISCYESIHEACNWRIFKDNDQVFKIERLYDYNAPEEGDAASLCIMVDIKKENKPMYDMLITTFALMIRKFNIPFYWNDGDVDHSLEMMEDEIEQCEDEMNDPDMNPEYVEEMKLDIVVWKNKIAEYRSGAPVELRNEILKDKKSLASLSKKVKAYSSKSKKDELAIAFIERSIRLLKEQKCYNFVDEFVNLTQMEYHGESPVWPTSYLQMGWCFDESSDIIAERINGFHESLWNEYGMMPCRLREVNEEDEDFNPFLYHYIEVLRTFHSLSREY